MERGAHHGLGVGSRHLRSRSLRAPTLSGCGFPLAVVGAPLDREWRVPSGDCVELLEPHSGRMACHADSLPFASNAHLAVPRDLAARGATRGARGLRRGSVGRRSRRGFDLHRRSGSGLHVHADLLSALIERDQSRRVRRDPPADQLEPPREPFFINTDGLVVRGGYASCAAAAPTGYSTLLGTNTSRALFLNAVGTVVLERLNLTGGHVAGNGGGLFTGRSRTTSRSRCGRLGNSATVSAATSL